MLDDYGLDEILPPGFARNTGVATVGGAVGAFAAILPVAFLGEKSEWAQQYIAASPVKAARIAMLATMATGLLVSRLAYRRWPVFAIGAAGGSIGTAASILVRTLYVTDAEVKAAASSGAVKGLSLAEMIEGESQGLYPANYAFP